ncbi:hypothetical protein ScalyP_jg5801 [Parmales sp. scaly parma]|nr:hypothetical protein ScalyP_jg5801 [Parmales sp. scaly parma]
MRVRFFLLAVVSTSIALLRRTIINIPFQILLISPPDSVSSQSFAVSTGRGDSCKTVTNPSSTTVYCSTDFGLTADSSLKPISYNANGGSTSSYRNPSKFVPPWTYSTSNSSLEGAVRQLKLELTDGDLLESKNVGNDNIYLHYTFPTIYPTNPISAVTSTNSNKKNVFLDDVEFLFLRDEEVVVTRSVSRHSIFVYPLQQQLGDKDSHKLRLEDIRTRLGWAKLDL